MYAAYSYVIFPSSFVSHLNKRKEKGMSDYFAPIAKQVLHKQVFLSHAATLCHFQPHNPGEGPLALISIL